MNNTRSSNWVETVAVINTGTLVWSKHELVCIGTLSDIPKHHIGKFWQPMCMQFQWLSTDCQGMIMWLSSMYFSLSLAAQGDSRIHVLVIRCTHTTKYCIFTIWLHVWAKRLSVRLIIVQAWRAQVGSKPEVVFVCTCMSVRYGFTVEI